MIVFLPWLRWLLAFHVMAFVAWMAGTFYLPRLYVYHCQTMVGSAESERFKGMERRLLRQIMTPAAIATLVFGAIMAAIPGVIDWSAPWWWLKLAGVAGLFAFHGACARWRRDFEEDRRPHPERYYRIANEVPTLLMALIVIMIIIRPWGG
ncbi:protoporphyrinogen oxidase HemJ [Brytella acorum]|uniref:Protoporphyrinogen IX oxidase n=1 Tax=Brytella acorum TaxID=2959299 RepID=A0AA35UX22_9PROT|nr:protoporphyrinogen oxidase HemJ [Brytella acorum]MDF3625060.1 protoporphyrinogen oxidase HemJ [Brytella acorum]CAI9121061.1 protoporphyrinogen oxidase HemJ [Brytella acorum]